MKVAYVAGGAAAVVVVAAGLYFGLSDSGGPDAGARAELALASVKESGGSYSYKSAESAGRGVVLKNVSIKSPANSSSPFNVTVAELRVRDMDWANPKAPDFADVEYRGIRFEGNSGEPAPLREFREAAGVKEFVVNVKAAYAFDRASRTLDVKSGDIELESFGTLSFTIKVDGIDKEKLSQLGVSQQPDPMKLMGAFAAMRLLSLRIAFKDAGGTSRILDAGAKKQNLPSGAALRDQALKQIEQQKAMVPFKIGRQALAAAESFLKRPGTFEVAASPRAPFAFATLTALFMGGPNPAAIDKLTDELGLSVAAK